ncbi:MAG: hypothetical protein ACK5KN_03915 [Dysgonomonas sp.]|jgi:hypothetical protein|uniref:hypothetical protein n=1 Tax=unclassified Dysgonomonas TaxID=2630389 RepID=UPI0025BF3081|nr:MULTISPECIES: hypothetical protein [unclassified Dysgonomonas]MDR1714843.1 hypothetical protein [Prevotella sp.]MDR2002887.1 hypothetical protein [Prevotella sp.]HMM04132.1 hypothetical protein [Dysgonomonas sp.]
MNFTKQLKNKSYMEMVRLSKNRKIDNMQENRISAALLSVRTKLARKNETKMPEKRFIGNQAIVMLTDHIKKVRQSDTLWER